MIHPSMSYDYCKIVYVRLNLYSYYEMSSRCPFQKEDANVKFFLKKILFSF